VIARSCSPAVSEQAREARQTARFRRSPGAEPSRSLVTVTRHRHPDGLPATHRSSDTPGRRKRSAAGRAAHHRDPPTWRLMPFRGGGARDPAAHLGVRCVVGRAAGAWRQCPRALSSSTKGSRMVVERSNHLAPSLTGNALTFGTARPERSRTPIAFGNQLLCLGGLFDQAPIEVFFDFERCLVHGIFDVEVVDDLARAVNGIEAVSLGIVLEIFGRVHQVGALH